MKNKLILGGVIIILLAGVWAWQCGRNGNAEEEEAKLGLQFINWAGDVVGTKVGTTTTPVGFGNDGTTARATSSYISEVGGLASIAVYTLQVQEASSTGDLHFEFLGSQDDHCNATATYSYLLDDIVLNQEINWFDISDHLTNKVHSTTLPSATTTFVWLDPLERTGKVIAFENLNYECLRLDVSGSSTELWAQLRLK